MNLAPLGIPRTDHHIHASHYRLVNPREDATPRAIRRRGAEIGLNAVGILEHVNPSPKHPLECYLALADAFHACAFPEEITLGVELDVLDDHGALTGPPDLRQRAGLHYVIASVHALADGPENDQAYIEANHRMLMGVVCAPDGADVLGHPWHLVARRLDPSLENPRWFEQVPRALLQELTQALAGHGRTIEINCRSERIFEDPAFREFAAGLRDAGVLVAVGSDAHDLVNLHRSLPIHEFLTEMQFAPRQIWRPRASGTLGQPKR